eukprot:416891-Rhodomonas_salina.1
MPPTSLSPYPVRNRTQRAACDAQESNANGVWLMQTASGSCKRRLAHANGVWLGLGTLRAD